MRGFTRAVVSMMIFLMAVPLNLLSFEVQSAEAAVSLASTSSNPRVVSMATTKNDPIELSSERDRFSKTYLLPDGKKRKVISSEPINYQTNENNHAVWKEIDSTLVPQATIGGAQQYKNKANDFSLTISDDLANQGVAVSKDNTSLNLKVSDLSGLRTTSRSELPLIGSAPVSTIAAKPVLTKDEAAYKNVGQDIDVNYKSTSTGVKDEIILNKNTSQNVFSFQLDLSGVYFKQLSTGAFVFYNSKTNEPTYYMPQSFMNDAVRSQDEPEGALSYDVKTEILPRGQGFEVRLTADKDWLNDPKRIYPVVIDPSVQVDLGYGEDSFVESGYPTINTWDQSRLYIGRTSYANKGVTRTYIPFSLPDLTHARIYGANFSAYQYYCDGVCQNTGVNVRLTGGYNPKTITWNNQPWLSDSFGQMNDGGLNKWINIDVTAAAKYWFEQGNPDGSMIGSLAFLQNDETNYGRRNWYAENSTNYSPTLSIDYNDYNDAIVVSSNFPTIYVDDIFSNLPANVANWGRNAWSQSNTRLSYHIYDSAGNCVNYEGLRTSLPRDVGGGGDQVSLGNVQLKVPSTPGDYLIKWDIVQEGITWLSQQGLATYDYWIHVNDYPEYDATYQPVNVPTSAASGSTINIPVTVQNNTRYNWATDKYKLSYHWVNIVTGEIVIKDGSQTQFPTQVSYRGGKGTVNLQVKSPFNSGGYKLKIDLLQVGVAWFSDKGVPTADYNINITTASLSNLTHLGTEDYYAKVGPVDLATGNLSYSSTDMAVNSNTGLLSVERSYNANSMDQTFNGDPSGYIQNWLLNGPYKENSQSLRLNEKYITNEETIRPNTGASINGKTWFKAATDIDIPTGESCNIPTPPPPSGRAVASSHPVLDINSALDRVGAVQSGYGNNSVVYANSYVYSPANQTVRLFINTDDGQKIWLNGQMIHSDDIYFGCYLGDGASLVSLKAGWNSILAKVSNYNNNWRFSVQLTNTAGGVVNGLKFAVDNQDIFGDNTTLGKGWTANFKERLVTTDLNNIYYRDGTGSVNLFVKKADGSYQRPTGATLDLAKNTNGTFTVAAKSGLKINFNATGILQNKTDLSGNVLSYQYDPAGNCIKIADTNRYITLSYTSGRLASISDQLGNKYTYNYDSTVSPVRLASVTDPMSNTFSYRYDADGRMTTFTSKSGSVTTISYNSDKKVSAIKDALGYSTSFTYRPGAVDITDALGRKSTAEIDKNNLLTAFTNAKTYREFYQYDGNYNILTVTPDLPVNDQYYFNWSYTYDSNNNLLSATDPMQQKTVFAYSGNDLVKQSDPDGSITQFLYSTEGRRLLLSSTDPKGNIDSSTYDSKGRKLSATDSMLSVTKFSYSTDGDILTATTPKGEVTTNTYDSIGRELTAKSPLGKVTTFTYNPLGLVTKVTDPAGFTALSDYDKNGRVIKQTDSKGVSKTFTYDAVGQLIKITDEIGAITQSAYDAVGNKIKDIDANGEVTTYQYDQLNQPITQTDPSAGKSTVTYDRNGAVTKITDPKNQSQSQIYDKNGNTTKTVDPEGTTTLTYDKDGKVVNAASTLNSENIAVSYDTNNNVTKLQSNLNGTVTATYNKNDSPVTIQTPTATAGLTYDANGQVSQVNTTINNQTLTTKFTKDADGKITKVSKPNGVDTTYFYDSSNRLNMIADVNAKGVLLSKSIYLYSKGLNATTIYDKNIVATQYIYDARNELTKEGNKTFSYDPMGNRKTLVDSTGTTTYVYDTAGDSNRLLKVTYPNGRTINYQYDANGNVIQQIDSAGGTATYTYDSDNYFVKAVLPDKSTVQYTYDKILKLRTKRIQTNPAGQITSTTNFIYDGDRLVSETDQNNKIIRSYSWDQNERLIGVSISDVAGALKNFTYNKNAKEDLVGMTDSSGNLVAEYSYDAWGNIVTSVTKQNSPIANLDKLNTRLYSSYWYDSALGLYFMKARMYNSQLGRFLSKDPAMTGGSALGSNPYIYCYNNPINNVDPNGKNPFVAALTLITAPAWVAEVAMAAVVTSAAVLVGYGAYALIDSYSQSHRVADDISNGTGNAADIAAATICAATIAAAGGAASRGNVSKNTHNTSKNYNNKPTPEPPNDPVHYKEIAKATATTLAGREALRLTDDQSALVAIAQRAKDIGAIALEDAKTLISWAQEYGVRYEDHLAGHPGRPYDLAHIAIYTVNHITVNLDKLLIP